MTTRSGGVAGLAETSLARSSEESTARTSARAAQAAHQPIATALRDALDDYGRINASFGALLVSVRLAPSVAEARRIADEWLAQQEEAERIRRSMGDRTHGSASAGVPARELPASTSADAEPEVGSLAGVSPPSPLVEAA